MSDKIDLIFDEISRENATYIETDVSNSYLESHRILSSLQEELEAIDYYNQRVDKSTDDESKEIFIHNRDEEIEHAAIFIEWLRRKIPKFNESLSKYLFKKDSIIDIEKIVTKNE